MKDTALIFISLCVGLLVILGVGQLVKLEAQQRILNATIVEPYQQVVREYLQEVKPSYCPTTTF